LGGIPEGWQVGHLRDLLHCNPRRSLKKGTIAPYLDMKNVPTSGHIADEVVDREMGSGTKFVNGDTLLARITPCLENGKTAYIDFLDEGHVGWGSTEYIVIRPQNEYPESLGYLIARNSEFRQHAIQSMTGTSGRQRANAKALEELPWLIYPTGVVCAFDRLGGGYLKLAKSYGNKSKNLSQLRDTLLPKLLSGELFVSAAETYLAKAEEPANAEKVLLEFLQADDLQSVQLNTLKSQRLILVAAHYRKEVTNTVLWLSQFGVICQCFKVTPYQAGAELFLNLEQIIPTPEAADFMIGMMAKEAEEKSASHEQKNRHTLRLAFWEQALEAFSHSNCTLYSNISPGKDHWLSGGSGLSSMPFNLIFGKNELRIEFSMQRSEPEANQFVFERLQAQKEKIEADFGASLTWLPLPSRKACRILFARPVDGYDKANWPEMIQSAGGAYDTAGASPEWPAGED